MSSGNAPGLSEQVYEELEEVAKGLEGYLKACESSVRSVASSLSSRSSALFVGRGLAHALAAEGALKLKEISYIHAEGYAADHWRSSTHPCQSSSSSPGSSSIKLWLLSRKSLLVVVHASSSSLKTSSDASSRSTTANVAAGATAASQAPRPSPLIAWKAPSLALTRPLWPPFNSSLFRLLVRLVNFSDTQ